MQTRKTGKGKQDEGNQDNGSCKGEYQVDGVNIPVKESSVFRVAPAGKRAVRNTGDQPLVMLCVQYKAAKPGSVNPSDGSILNEPVALLQVRGAAARFRAFRFSLLFREKSAA